MIVLGSEAKLVTPQDSAIIVADYLRPILTNVAASCGSKGSWTISTIVDSGKTPTNYVQVRVVNITDEQVVAHHHRIDLLVWADGTSATEKLRQDVARALFAYVRHHFTAQLVTFVPAAPDPADPTKRLAMLTVELLLNAQQL